MVIHLIAIFCILFLQQGHSYAQHSLSIYEYGNPITDYEDNFKNLIKNWNTRSVTNADEYEILECTFVETISTWERYNHYRNYFSSDQAVGCTTKGQISYDNKGKKTYKFIIRPGFPYTEFYDTRGYPNNMKTILTDEFRERVKRFLSQELNIDTMNLYQYRYHAEKGDTTAYSWSHSVNSQVINTPESLSKNYIDIFIEGRKNIFELNIPEAQDVILEDLIIKRLNQQVYFNESVKIGDKVFVIKFQYEGRLYLNYIICSAQRKKVVWDHYFNRIKMDHLIEN